MKREHFIALFIVILTAAMGLAGCSDDSTGPSDPPEGEPITGTWQLASLVFTSNGVDLDVTVLDPCLLDTTLTFEEDGSFSASYSSGGEGGEGGECATTTTSGTWEHESDTTYNIQAEGLPIAQGTQELSFSNNNNTFSFSEMIEVQEIEGEGTITFNRQ